MELCSIIFNFLIGGDPGLDHDPRTFHPSALDESSSFQRLYFPTQNLYSKSHQHKLVVHFFSGISPVFRSCLFFNLEKGSTLLRKQRGFNHDAQERDTNRPFLFWSFIGHVG
ncbi:hypothetical protein PV04_08558 [Phialophora macrospora]|uniref:Uncharacterized protein n=1 Tax=Phialophora macrospora TaxID=1851006 RepID=A0A0D2F6L5_9EURO|nr:hypothetical protein PV04_08558 [Phialophora macrospora]